MGLTSAAFNYVESKTPTWVKVCIALVIIGWMTPLKVLVKALLEVQE